jgi:pimeloyl-ACP methyl ester carboxylesterase
LLTALIVLLGLIAALASFTAVQALRIEARYPPMGLRIDIGGGAIHVLDRLAKGEERGAVLLIHGASGNASDMFVALAETLARRGFRVLGVDRPGHGWSDRIGGRAASSPVLQADALRRAAEKLGVAKAVVAAHSLGAVAGLAMALNHPEFVRALTLIAPVSHPWPGGVAWYYAVGAHPLFGPPFRRLLTLPIGMAWMGSAVASVFAPNPAPSDFIEATRLALVLRPLQFRANCEDVADAEAAVAALSPQYGQIRAPTEVVTGDSDGVVYAHIHSRGLARDIPGARLTTLEGVGHSPHHAAPDRVVELILEADRRARARDLCEGLTEEIAEPRPEARLT